MTSKHFAPYQQVIAASIRSCTNNEQLFCCYDMIDRFKEIFKPFMSGLSVHQAAGDLYEAYHRRQAELGVQL
ncbi:MAG TPA: hypothetical protein PLS07_00760 [Niabella sp.]|nr:hypothetical protein [Niabella sp.]HQW14916.1 hypothetical protein [Niabella sp.]HQX18459.1 hypothetical protein [Niabella sp.]HRB05986.1 hypothetical protein [Niabella sp.]HRB36878.1 hypothetical protein [Niabella sp.]